MWVIKVASCGPDGFHTTLSDLEDGLHYALTTLINVKIKNLQLVEIKTERTDRNSGKQKLLGAIKA